MQPKIKTYPSLRPLSRLYGFGVNLRNKLFDNGKLKQRRFDIPIICVGNITAGGTGKTPHTEYLIRLLLPHCKVAVLSQGYKRKSKGFRIVEVDSKVQDVGDEPLQIKQKYPETLVVVDKKRVNAIEKILSIEKEERPDVILLDDGFQHRYVQPSLSILLINSNRPVFDDELLPAGLLREPLQAINRADIVIVTKCDSHTNPFFYRDKLNLQSHRELYFTMLDYGTIKPIFPDLQNKQLELSDLRKRSVFLTAGIASPQPLVDKLKQKTDRLHTQFFPDHHFFNAKDVENIRKQIDSIDDENKIILTTEKDAVRFRTHRHVDNEMKKMMYYIPICVEFWGEEAKKRFDNKIIQHIESFQKS